MNTLGSIVITRLPSPQSLVGPLGRPWAAFRDPCPFYPSFVGPFQRPDSTRVRPNFQHRPQSNSAEVVDAAQQSVLLSDSPGMHDLPPNREHTQWPECCLRSRRQGVVGSLGRLADVSVGIVE